MRLETISDVAKKELALFFSSPIGYLFLFAYLGVTLFVFFWGEAFFARNIADVRPMFEWLPILLIFLAAALTMRMWSDERRTGTLEFVVTLPASIWEFVLGKFLACWSLLGIALLLTLPLPMTVAVLGDLDWGPVFAGYLAAMLLGAAYLSIGLFVSAKSDNQIVSLILASFACGVFYLIGSPFLIDLSSNEVAEVLRALGAGARFESITRGVLDLRDLYYYFSIAGVFLALNAYALQAHGWAHDGDAKRHSAIRITVAFLAANLLAANFWLHAVTALRWDVTEGDQYSISDATRAYLGQLREPLLVRGYFSAKTHPLLAPLVPQIKDLLAEYEVAGDGRVRVELVDPAEEPELEDEANTKYGIRPVPFQVADRYQASLVNSYFDVLILYGDEYEVLGFRELIEVKVRSENDLDVQLRNPEYDITRSIKKVLYGFQGGGSVFDSVADPVKFTGYLSSDERLPAALAELRPVLAEVLEGLEQEAEGKFGWEFVDPDADGGDVAVQIAQDYGFRPMAASLFDLNSFYFYLTLSGSGAVVQIPIPDTLDEDNLKRGLEEGLKRFATGLLKSVAFSAPEAPPPFMAQQMPMPPPQGKQYSDLRDFLTSDFDVETSSLNDQISASADVLVVVEPTDLSAEQVFAIDQFLMRGGTVVVAAGGFQTNVAETLTAVPASSGLDDWLEHNGVTIEKSMVLDPRSAAFPVPVRRSIGGLTFQDMRMVEYPFFVDVRDAALNRDSPITSELPQVTVAWASPLSVDAQMSAARTVTRLLESSPGSWADENPEVMPDLNETGFSTYTPEGDVGPRLLGVLVEGRFESFFEESPLLKEASDDASEESEAGEGGDKLGKVSSVITRSPESARLIVFGSSEFLADQTIRLIGSPDGTLYGNSIQLLANVVDWAVEDESLLSIRSRGHFNRTLPPMPEGEQRVWEYVNYALGLLGVLVVFGVNRQRRAARRAGYVTWLEARS